MTIRMTEQLPVTRYRTIEAANVVASKMNADGSGWTYTVKASGNKFVIVCADEDGFELGAL